MSQNSGFILHTKDYKSKDTIDVTNSINLTCSTQIIEDIVLKKGPNKYFISLGYSGWGTGQLEKEIIDNSWIHIGEKLDLIFDIDVDKKWNKAINFTGIDFSKFSPHSGNA